MTTKYTPGPWRVEWSLEEDSPNHAWIDPVTFHPGKEYLNASGWMSDANANLIAAAPELYEALKEMRTYLANDLWFSPKHDVRTPKLFQLVDAAIAKAEGRRE